jgi:hypothetical protein
MTWPWNFINKDTRLCMSLAAFCSSKGDDMSALMRAKSTGSAFAPESPPLTPP